MGAAAASRIAAIARNSTLVQEGADREIAEPTGRAPRSTPGRIRSLHEIALNPATFSDRSDEEILSTLVHEMCHLWQQCHGRPGRRGYHIRDWAAQMLSIGIGLYPSDTGRPGGRMVGERVSHYVVAGAPFAVACAELLGKGFALTCQDDRVAQGDSLRRLARHTRHRPGAAPSAALAAAWGLGATGGAAVLRRMRLGAAVGDGDPSTSAGLAAEFPVEVNPVSVTIAPPWNGNIHEQDASIVVDEAAGVGRPDGDLPLARCGSARGGQERPGRERRGPRTCGRRAAGAAGDPCSPGTFECRTEGHCPRGCKARGVSSDLAGGDARVDATREHTDQPATLAPDQHPGRPPVALRRATARWRHAQDGRHKPDYGPRAGSRQTLGSWRGEGPRAGRCARENTSEQPEGEGGVWNEVMASAPSWSGCASPGPSTHSWPGSWHPSRLSDSALRRGAWPRNRFSTGTSARCQANASSAKRLRRSPVSVRC
ncbi:MAG: SprT-like domain-containing protein [Vitreoscilla sp.]|nr:SprT-like domain-containing protein [Vitreoscilla sp.]